MSARLCRRHADTERPSRRPLCLVAKSCPTLCHPMDLSRQAPCPWGFSRQEYWRGLHALLQGIVPNQGLNPVSCIAGGFLPSGPQGSPLWWKSPGGHRKPNTAPEACARVGKLSFVGCRRGLGKSHHGSPPGVQLSLDLFRFRPTGLEPWFLVFLGDLASVVGRGHGSGTVSLGSGVLC